MKKGGDLESTIIIGPSKSKSVYALHSLEYILSSCQIIYIYMCAHSVVYFLAAARCESRTVPSSTQRKLDVKKLRSQRTAEFEENYVILKSLWKSSFLPIYPNILYKHFQKKNAFRDHFKNRFLAIFSENINISTRGSFLRSLEKLFLSIFAKL